MGESKRRGDAGKHQECTDHAIIERIRELAEDPYAARFTYTCELSLEELRLTRRGLLQVICDYIDEGGVVDVTITDTTASQLGQPMYVMYPTVEHQDLYVKVRIDESADYPLIVISAHE